MSSVSDAGIDKDKLNKIKIAIIKAEKDNLQTGEKTHEAMVETIKKIISLESKKSF